ncbi:unnamed protein product [Lymnaea stagnalis]|uniref:Uncharacterized protein n=1 Tax=Lymnaea stagnalis TaxID=6523 RepID=A0AAV2ICG7_LYMST
MRIHRSDDNRATASTRVERFTIADAIEIQSRSTDGEANCSAGVIAAVVVYGQAVCPYRRWGANCEKECRCPCEVVECHPSTGDCRTRGFACSPGTFGPTCLRKCSENCSGSPLECHVLSGVCKRCFGGDRMGVRCERRLTDAELAERRSACERFKEDVGLKTDTMLFRSRQVQPESKEGGAPKANTSLMVAMATAVVLVTFVAACLIYFMLIRHCAQERLKKIAEIDKERKRRISMMSYSELQKEYMERTGRSRTDLKASRSISSGHQVQLLPRAATPTSAGADDNTTATTETSLLGMFRWNRRLISIVKGGPDHRMGDHGV